MMTGKRQNSIHFFVILGLLVSLIWPVAQATAHASQAQAAPASQAAPQTPPDKPEKPPVDPALTALDRPAKSADPQAASQPQMNTPQAYSYTYEWTGTQTIVDNSCVWDASVHLARRRGQLQRDQPERGLQRRS